MELMAAAMDPKMKAMTRDPTMMIAKKRMVYAVVLGAISLPTMSISP